MDLLCLATSTYDDPWAREWHPDLRWTVGYLRRNGIDTAYSYLPAPRDPTAILDSWPGDPPRAVFVELTEENRDPVLRFLAALRPEWPTTAQLIGGIAATLDGGTLLSSNPHVSACVAGEREETLVEVARRLDDAHGDRRCLDDVPGLRSADHPPLPRPLLPDLDTLGTMATDGIEELLAAQPPGPRTAYVKASRGCYARCTFCGVPDIFRFSGGRPWRGRGAVAVADELALLANHYGVSSFVFQDDNFVGPGETGQMRLAAIAREILSRGLRIEFAICCTLSALRRPTLELLQEAGLRRVGVSVESLSPASLALLGKGHKAEWVYPKLRILEDLGLACEINLIFFDPSTTLAGVRRSLDLLAYIRDSRHLTYSDAFPFNELRVFSWSRVRSRLMADGSLGPGNTWRYADPAVAQLAAFVARLETSAGLTFKNRLLFRSLDPVEQLRNEHTLLQLSAGLRHWVGLTVLPRYVAAACDVLEHVRGNEADQELALLTARFEYDLAPLRALEWCVRTPPPHLDRPPSNDIKTRTERATEHFR